MQNFRALGALPPHPRASSGWGLCPQTPQTAPPHCEFLATRLHASDNFFLPAFSNVFCEFGCFSIASVMYLFIGVPFFNFVLIRDYSTPLSLDELRFATTLSSLSFEEQFCKNTRLFFAQNLRTN